MKGIKINFLETGAVIDFEKEVNGFEAVNQDALVNLGTQKGSDKSDKARGSSLEALTLKSSAIVSLQTAQHAVNIASAETSSYNYETDDYTETDKLLNIELKPTVLSLEGLKINAITLSETGKVIGTNATLI